MDISPINSTTFKTRLGDDEVIIGGKNPLVFEPEIDFSKWQGENSLTIKPLFDIPNAVTSLVGNKIEHKGDKIGWYANPDPDNPDNLKFGLILYEKPATNVFTFALEGWEEFNFYKQPPYKNINDDGSSWEENEYGGERRRLPNMNNAYAIRHKTKSNYIIGGINYKTGFMGVFQLPKYIDSEGKWVWGILEYKDGLLTETCPQEFLDIGKYPIKSNLTFGNTGITSTDSWNDNYCRVTKSSDTPASSGTLTSMSAYCYVQAGTTATYNPALYNQSGTNPDARLAYLDSGGTALSDSIGWITTNLDYASITSGTQYWLGILAPRVGTGYVYLAYVTVSGTGKYSQNTTWQNPFVIVANLDFQYAIYATYTPSGGATSTTGEKYPTSATTSATGAHIDDDFVRTAAIMTANAGTADAACISASTFDAGDQTYILKATNFDFSGILAGSQINGVICRFEGWANTSGATAVSVACDLAQLLNTSRAETGENIVSAGLWTTVFLSATTGIVSLGNSANLWSCALTADWVKNANFGVALGFITGVANTDLFIDYVTLEIVYTPPAAVAALSLMYHFIEC
jgi:hypothetical protein